MTVTGQASTSTGGCSVISFTCAVERVAFADGVPLDFGSVVEPKGDRFRDDFTRTCLVLANRHVHHVVEPSDHAVIVGTEYGNLEAMLRFQRQVMARETVSAQQFPHATTSSASVFLNIGQGMTGGSSTLNAGPLTAVMAILQGLLHVDSVPTATGHVWIGDVYCAEAIEDVRKVHEGTITPGVVYCALGPGADHRVDLVFGPDERSTALALDAGAGVVTESHSDADDIEYNRAFITHRFLGSAAALSVGERSSMLLTHDGATAGIAITRLPA